MSKSGDYDDYTSGASDDAAIDITIAASEVNAIRWMLSGKVLALGTTGGEWSIGPLDSTTPLTPSNIQAKRQTNFGSANIQAISAGKQILHAQYGGKKLREYAYSWEADSYQSADLLLLAEHLTENTTIKEIAFQKTPNNTLWCVLNDGDMLALTYLRDQNVIAWSNVTTDGNFENVAVIPGPNNKDQVWVVVKRTVDGTDYRFIEYFEDVYDSDAADSFYVDSGLSYVGSGTTTVSGLNHLAGATVSVVADGAYVGDQVVSPNADSYTPLLLHGDGNDASTTFTDSSTTGYTVTAYGNAQIDTAQKKFGTGSALFDGTGDYLSVPDNADWFMSAGKFTIDFWVRFNAINTINPFFQQYVSATDYVNLYYGSSGYIYFLISESGAAKISVIGAWAPSTDTWYHIALIRGWEGGADDWAMTIDGVAVRTFSDVDDWQDLAGTLDIGKRTVDGPTYLNGWIDEFRVSKGIARWTANFTPSSVAYPSTETAGVISIATAASKIHAGLAYTATLETIDLPPGTGMDRRIIEVTPRFYRACQGEWGSTSADLDTIDFAASGATPYTGSIDLLFPGGWKKDQTILFQSDEPLPFSISGILVRYQ